MTLEINQTLLGVLLGLGVSAASGALAYFVFLSGVKDQIAALDKRLACVETKTEVTWKAIEKSLVDLLHSPHTPETDDLLEKMAENRLTQTEIYRLMCIADTTIAELKAARDAARQARKVADKAHYDSQLLTWGLLKAGLDRRLAI
jgi:hypothetical protein